jgi:hypothetical protein
MSIPDATQKPITEQAYNQLNWAAGLLVKGMKATASTISSIVNTGINEDPPFAKDLESAFRRKQIERQGKIDAAFACPFLERTAAVARKAQPESSRITVLYAADYGLIPPLTEQEKQIYREIPATSSRESMLNTLFRMDPKTGNIYNRRTDELIPRR